jgi:hypothetical protein
MRVPLSWSQVVSLPGVAAEMREARLKRPWARMR